MPSHARPRIGATAKRISSSWAHTQDQPSSVELLPPEAPFEPSCLSTKADQVLFEEPQCGGLNRAHRARGIFARKGSRLPRLHFLSETLELDRFDSICPRIASTRSAALVEGGSEAQAEEGRSCSDAIDACFPERKSAHRKAQRA